MAKHGTRGILLRTQKQCTVETLCKMAERSQTKKSMYPMTLSTKLSYHEYEEGEKGQVMCPEVERWQRDWRER